MKKAIINSSIQSSLYITSILMFFLSNFSDAQEMQESTFNSVEFTIVLTKQTTDYDLNRYVSELKGYGIKFEIQRKKRNTQGLLTELVMVYKDQQGNKGKSKQIRTIPIRKVFMNIKRFVDGTNQISFFDHESLKNKPFDAAIEKKMATIENLKHDTLIYIDSVLSNINDLEKLDIYAIDKIEILTDIASLKKYNAIKKKEVVIVTIIKFDY